MMKKLFIYTFLTLAFPIHAQSAFRLHMGAHHQEYFADRMILKAKLLGYPQGAKVSQIRADKSLVYRSHLDFADKSAAEIAASQLKKMVPDAQLQITEIK